MGITYVFVYIPDKEKELQEQHFRALQRTDGNIEEKLTNIVTILGNLLDPYIDNEKDSANSKASDSKLVEAFITSNNKNNGWKNFTINQTKKNSAADIEKKYPASIVTLNKNDKGTYRQLIIDSNLRSFSIAIVKKKDSATYYEISLNTSFQQFFVPLLTKDIFDQYIIFDEGNPIYESFPSGVSYDNQDSLLSVSKGIQSSLIRDISVGGVEYKIFLQPLNFDATHKWVMAGLLSKSRYAAESKKLPTAIILLLVTIAITIIVAFPWIKIFQMGHNNLLTLTDATSSISVSILLMSLLFFIFFRYNKFYKHNSDDKPNCEKVIADNIAKAFHAELIKGYDQLYNFDTVMFNRSDTSIPEKLKLNRDIVWIDSSLHRDSTIKNIFLDTGSFVKILWIDTSARERFSWLNTGRPETHVYNLWPRDYYKNIKNGKPMYLDGDLGKPFYLDQVVSRTDGVFRTIIAKKSVAKSLGISVAALGYTMKTLNNVILPAGYNYAITDFKGKVLYCNDSTKNLNENFLEEFSASSHLQTAFASHTSEKFHTDYYDKRYKVYTQPIDNLPYYIIVFSDTEYKNTRDAEVFSFTISMLTLFFIFIIAQVVIIILFTNKLRIPDKHFVTNFLWPRKKLKTDYNMVSAMNIVAIVFLISVFNSAGFIEYFLYLTLAVTLSAFIPVLLALKEKKEAFKSVFLCLVAFWIVINIISASIVGQISFSLIFIELLFIILGLLTFFLRPFFKDDTNDNGLWSYIHSYTLMNTTRLVLTSGIPVLFFYVTSFNYEQKIITRYRQVDFASQLIKKFPSVEKAKAPGTGFDLIDTLNTFDFFNTKSTKPKDSLSKFKKGIYTNNKWITGIGLSNHRDSINLSQQDVATIKILNLFRLYKNDESLLENNLYKQTSDDELFSFSQPIVAVPGKTGGNDIFSRRLAIDSSFLVISSAPDMYSFPGFLPLGQSLFWLLFCILLCLFFRLMLLVSRKLFAYSLEEISPDNFIECIVNGKENCIDRSLYIINVNMNELYDKLIETIQLGNISVCTEQSTPVKLFIDHNRSNISDLSNVGMIDFIKLPDSDAKTWEWKRFTENFVNKKYTCVIIKNFSFNAANVIENYERLKFIETMATEETRVVIISSLHPDYFIKSLPALPALVEDQRNKLSEYATRFETIFFNYKIVYYPLNKESVSNIIAGKRTLYKYLWASMSEGEKFILYDLAKDGLVNVHDDTCINILMKKGVLTCNEDKQLYFFDKNFKDFILKALGNKGLELVQSHVEDNGNWNKLKMPLALIIVAALVLLFSSQENSYSKLIGYLGAFAAAIPTVLRVLSIFEKPEKKT